MNPLTLLEKALVIMLLTFSRFFDKRKIGLSSHCTARLDILEENEYDGCEYVQYQHYN